MAGELPLYEAETDGVIVRVRPKFLHDESEPGRGRFVWAYTVEIENTTTTPWQLVSRHWLIIDSLGRRQSVDGEGVVGQQPVIGPGERFRYTSGAPLAAPSGVMGGRYDLVAPDGSTLSATIPHFSLDSPFERSRPS